MASVSLQNILQYVEITPNSRNLIEAERLLKSEFVITFGATKITENSLDILALCLKTSGMKEAPHTIKGTLKKNNSEYEIETFSCTCKAGAGVCKHKTAVLLLCYRNNLDDITLLSSTDVKCLWKSKQTTVNQLHAPVPVSDFCHVECKTNIGNIDTDGTLQTLLEACPTSALALALKGAKRKQANSERQDEIQLSKR